MRRPLLGLAAIAALGCALGEAIGTASAGGLLALAVASGLLALRARAAWASAALAFGVLGVAAAAAATERAAFDRNGLIAVLAAAPAGPVEVEGVALADGSLVEGRGQLVLTVDRVGTEGLERPGRLRIAVGGEATLPPVLEGDRVRVWTTLRAPRGYATPGARDTEAEARRDGLAAFGYCKSARLVEVADATGSPLALARAIGRNRIARFVAPGPEQGLVRAMLLGDRAGLDRETLESFRASGTYHVLALSGAQVALVAALLLATLRRLGVGPGPAGPLVALGVFAYAGLVGAEAPVVRAAIMAGVVLVGRSLELDADVVNLLGLAALVLLMRKPSEVADPGFQLSFVATLGLVVLTEPLRSFLPAWPFKLDLALAGSLAAQLALAPLLAVHFHRLAPAALLLNLVAVPLATAVLLAGAALVVAAVAWPALGPPLGAVAWTAARALLASGQAPELVPALDVRVPDPVLPVLLVHGLGVALLVFGRRGAGLLASSLALGGLAWGGPGAPGDGRLEVNFLDVGQGDAIVLRSPSGRYMLVDAGGSFDERFDVGETVVAPFLWRRRVREIDALVLTHAHPDHVAGAPRLARSFGVAAVWEGPAPSQDRVYAELDAALRAAGAARLTLRRGARFAWDGVCLEVRGPAPPARPPLRTRNDDSLVIELTFGAVAMLLTGDVEAAGEASLAGGPVSLLKVAHHGSRTSTTAGLLDAADPELAVISVGNRNPFGHPAAEVMERLRDRGVRIFRTDHDGTVQVDTDGRDLRVRSSRSQRDENIRVVRKLRASDDVLPSGTCRRF